jgi:sigma-B regulation protein RsbU (phosphoserine phosphatase)
VSTIEDPDVAAVARISAVPTILRVIGQATGLRLTLIARVTEDTWKACAVDDRMNFGLEPGGLLDVATTLCSEVRASQQAIVIECASQDPVYRNHHTPRLYGIESYISVPIFLRDGSYFGNVCGLDSRPAKLRDTATLEMLELYAELIGLQLEAEERQRSTHEALLDARATAELREQFIAVLGHDMRTPLGAVTTGTELLLRRQLPPGEHKILERMRGSVVRMTRLVDDLLDFARGRLGGGIPLSSEVIDDLEPLFRQIVEEARARHPGRVIHYEASPSIRIHGDRSRLGQLLANLIGNALEHGTADTPVHVALTQADGAVALTVYNHGEPIPEAARARLFQPFFRGTRAEPQAGLGLGLYIVSEIVKSHRGRIEVHSSPGDGTRFVCTLPALV